MFVEFPQYRGEQFFKDDEARRNWVPIVPFHANVERKTKSRNGPRGMKRVNIPIVAARALTVWKAQGLTLGKVVYHPGDWSTPGLLYTAATRV